MVSIFARFHFFSFTMQIKNYGDVYALILPEKPLKFPQFFR
jgi:hypothetical protein